MFQHIWERMHYMFRHRHSLYPLPKRAIWLFSAYAFSTKKAKVSFWQCPIRSASQIVLIMHQHIIIQYYEIDTRMVFAFPFFKCSTYWYYYFSFASDSASYVNALAFQYKICVLPSYTLSNKPAFIILHIVYRPVLWRLYTLFSTLVILYRNGAEITLVQLFLEFLGIFFVNIVQIRVLIIRPTNQ